MSKSCRGLQQSARASGSRSQGKMEQVSHLRLGTVSSQRGGAEKGGRRSLETRTLRCRERQETPLVCHKQPLQRRAKKRVWRAAVESGDALYLRDLVDGVRENLCSRSMAIEMDPLSTRRLSAWLMVALLGKFGDSRVERLVLSLSKLRREGISEI